ncbi:protein FAM122A [Denticeps clupeoides]|uniref:protein FAM122A n=1 Tax=Denticeps clupeoides TaxID=299321 RepID=UPI0010A37C5C|nr:protein FAM122A-like [Denticeps clupeoides]XP_028840299.1 protein FAM122A-like [Denticeps clupeoides]
MERMEVDQCAGAAGAGGGALRRSNSAPMITCASDSSSATARYRRSSVSVNPSCPSTLPHFPFTLTSERVDPKRLVENMETSLRGSLHKLCASPLTSLPPTGHGPDQILPDIGVTPNSSPSPTRRFRGATLNPAVRWSALTPLKRKGGVESDGPPKKLFVAGVTDPTHLSSYMVSVSPAANSTEDLPVCASPLNCPVSLSPPPPFTHHHQSF